MEYEYAWGKQTELPPNGPGIIFQSAAPGSFEVVTIAEHDPINDPTPRKKSTYKNPDLPSPAEAFVLGFGFGATTVASAAVKLGTLGYANLDAQAAELAAAAHLDETTIRLTQLSAGIGVNALAAVAAPAALAGVGRLASAAPGVSSILASPAATLVGRGISGGSLIVNGAGAIGNGREAIKAAQNGDWIGAVEHGVATIENFAGAYSSAQSLKAGFARPKVGAAAIDPPCACFVSGTPVLSDEKGATSVEIAQQFDDKEPSDARLPLVALGMVTVALVGWSVGECRSQEGDDSKRQTKPRSCKRQTNESDAEDQGEEPTSTGESATDRAWEGFLDELVAQHTDQEVAMTSGRKLASETVNGELQIKVLRPAMRAGIKPSRRWGRIWFACWLTAASILAAVGILKPQPQQLSGTTTVASRSVQPRSVAIESLRVGDRVAAGGSPGDLSGETQVNPTTWRLIELYADVVYPDGTPDEFQIETLQPPEWVAEHHAELGAVVPVPLDLVELGLPEGFRATVVVNEPCPIIKNGAGRVVLATISHLSTDIYELTVASPAGQVETVRPTGWHLFYRATDKAWVQTQDLTIGDELEGATGAIFVRDVRQIPGTHRVYNMTVEDDHVYRVSLLGALVHNNGGCSLSAPDPRRRPGYDPGNIHQDHPISPIFGGDPNVTRPFPGGSNLRKGGLEGELQKYKNYLIRNGLEEPLANKVIADEVDSLRRDVIAAPFGKVFPPGFRVEDLDR